MANRQIKHSKLVVLGTANFGLKKYGINKLKITNKNKNKILNYALNKNILYFDTAYSYNSEKFLNLKKIKIFTKLKPINENIKFKDKNSLEKFIKDSINNSLKELKTESIYCLMLHRVEDISVNNHDVIAILNKYKKKGLIQNIGVSIVSGDITLKVAQATYEATNADEEANGVGIKFQVSDNMSIAAYTVKVDHSFKAPLSI